MFNTLSKTVKGKTLAFAIAATALSSTQAFGSSLESSEYGNSAWNWWENSASTQVQSAVENNQTDTLLAHPETRSSEYGHVAWSDWKTGTSNGQQQVQTAQHTREASPEFGHIPLNWWENS